MSLKASKIQKIEKIRIDDVFDIHHFKDKSEFLKQEPNLVVNQIVIHNCGTHAGGLVVANNLNRYMPLIKSQNKTQSPWSEGANVRHLEPLGFVKYDLLGLSTLRIFENTISLIIKSNNFNDIKNWYNENIHPDKINFDDKKVYEETFHKGIFPGIFQFQEQGMQHFAKSAKPSSLKDITALTSLWRPGPMSIKAHEGYLEAKKNPENIKYFHPIVKEILGPNYGYIIYQEDLAWLAHKLGKDISLEEGNLLRKVLTKKGTGKGHEVKEAIYKKFIDGCREKFINDDDSNRLWESMTFFSQYGFNKCLSENTKVETKDGYKNIQDVKIGEYVNSQNGFIKVINVYKNGKKDVYRLETKSGKELICTLDHKIETAKPNSKDKMVRLKDLKNGDILVTKNGLEWMSETSGYRYHGTVETYDLEVEHKDHTFYANDISVSNSHALAYSVISFQCAWFLTYYPDEWLCAYLNEEPDDSKEKAISIVQSLGYQIAEVNINTSNIHWVPSSKIQRTLVQPLTSIKGLGEKAIEQIVDNRPFNKIEDLMFNDKIKYQKLNKKGIDVLIRSGACNDLMDSRFKHLKHFWLTCAFEKPKTVKAFLENIETYKNELDFTLEEKINNISSLTGKFPLNLVASQNVLNKLQQQHVPGIGLYDPELLYCWFIVREVIYRKTKTNKDYLELVVTDSSSKMNKIKCWGITERDKVYVNKLYISKLEYSEQWGFSCRSIYKNFKMIGGT